MDSSNTHDTEPAPAFPKRLPLVTGIFSIVLFVLFLFPTFGPAQLFLSMACGVVAIVTGILALRTGSFRGTYVTSIALGSLGLLLSAGVWIFAMVFIGAIG